MSSNSKYFDQTNMFLEPKVTQHGSHMVMTDVAMPTKIKHLSIDTRFRDVYDSSLLADYTITLPERMNNVRSMEIESIEFPFFLENVSASRGNNCFQLKLGTNEKTVIIDDGNYTTTTLITEIQNKINALGSPFDNSGGTGIGFTITNNYATFTNNSTTTNCTLVFDKSDCSKPSVSLQSKIGWTLGYRLNEYTIPFGDNKIGQSIINLNFDPYYFLIIDEFSNANPHSFNAPLANSEISTQQIIGRITKPEGIESTNLLIADKNQNLIADVRKYSNEINIQRLRVQIVNPFGKIINNNGIDFSFCLKFEYL